MAAFAIIIMLFVFWSAIKQLAANRRSAARKLAIVGSPSFSTAYLLDAQVRHSPAIAIDTRQNQFALAYSGNDALFFDFQDLVEVEFKSNGNTLTTTNRGSQFVGAAIGGLLLGGLGVAVGGLSGSRTSVEKIKRISLMLYTNRLDRPAHEIVFLDSSRGLSPRSKDVRTALQHATDWYARFRTILRATPQSVTMVQAPVRAITSDRDY